MEQVTDPEPASAEDDIAADVEAVASSMKRRCRKRFHDPEDVKACREYIDTAASLFLGGERDASVVCDPDEKQCRVVVQETIDTFAVLPAIKIIEKWGMRVVPP